MCRRPISRCRPRRFGPPPPRPALSVFLAETWGCRVSRFRLEGPRVGKTEPVIADLPGYPDNISRGSRGGHWVALAGTRRTSYDLAMTMPGVRRRMARRVAGDQSLFLNVNVGRLVHFAQGGSILETLWDLAGENNPAITSMREHQHETLIRHMLGRSLTNQLCGRVGVARKPRPAGGKVLSVPNLSMQNVVGNTPFSIFSGQMTGVVGLVGSGRTEAAILQLISAPADEGLAVVVISSHLPVILNLSDRILVARRGKIVEELSPSEATTESAMFAAVY